MSIPTFRKMPALRELKDVKQMAADIEFNFDLIKAKLVQQAPGAGVISLIVEESDGTWHPWTLVAGAGVSFVQDNAARTLTVKAP